jgi:hypothetical protein
MVAGSLSRNSGDDSAGTTRGMTMPMVPGRQRFASRDLDRRLGRGRGSSGQSAGSMAGIVLGLRMQAAAVVHTGGVDRSGPFCDKRGQRSRRGSEARIET